jgi:L-iditol 2-dehydrogenase
MRLARQHKMVRAARLIRVARNLDRAVVSRRLAVNQPLRLQGSFVSPGEYAQCISLMAEGAIEVKPFICAAAPLRDGAEWFARLYERAAGLLNVVLQPSGE